MDRFFNGSAGIRASGGPLALATAAALRTPLKDLPYPLFRKEGAVYTIPRRAIRRDAMRPFAPVD